MNRHAPVGLKGLVQEVKEMLMFLTTILLTGSVISQLLTVLLRCSEADML